MTPGDEPTGGGRPRAAAPSAWPWRLVAIALGLLVAGALLAGGVALALLQSVSSVAERTLLEDAAYEDEAEDLLVGVLALKGEHTRLTIAGSTRAGLADHAASLEALREDLDELAALGIRPEGVPTPEELRAVVEGYAVRVGPVLADPATPAGDFDAAMDDGLARLAELERSATAVDAIGTVRAADALRRLGEETDLAFAVLVAVLVAAALAGIVVAGLGIRVLGELRRLATAERRAAEDVAELLRTRTDIIADASHELRTPITVLRGTAELGARIGPPDCAHVPILRDIGTEASRMGRLVDDLLFLARHDAGAGPIDPEPVELEVLAADLAARAEALARERGVTLAVRLQAEGSAELDAGRLEQATLILVDNAAAYGPPTGSVELDVMRVGGELVIEVRDRGPGIPPDMLPHVFQRFRRGDTLRRRREGAGLGLAIALAIAEEHGGTAAAATRDGGGTRMTLRIPLRAGFADR